MDKEKWGSISKRRAPSGPGFYFALSTARDLQTFCCRSTINFTSHYLVQGTTTVLFRSKKMGKNLTGGDFFGAVPKECFGSGNPCTMQGSCHKTCNTDVAGNRAELEKATTKTPDPAKRPIEGFDQPGDDYRMAAPHCL